MTACKKCYLVGKSSNYILRCLHFILTDDLEIKIFNLCRMIIYNNCIIASFRTTFSLDSEINVLRLLNTCSTVTFEFINLTFMRHF